MTFDNKKLALFPKEIYIEPTNHCNLRCKMCPQGYDLVHKKGFIQYSLVEKIIDDIISIEGYTPKVGFHMNGEPLLHKELPNMISYATQNGLYTFLHTNGTLLTEKISNQLISAGLTEISFSFEGENPKIYEATRLNAKHDIVLKNIQYFLNIKAQTKTIIEVLKFRNIDPTLNISKDFKKQFPGAGFRSFYASNWAGSLNLPELSEKAIVQRPHTICGDMKNVLAISWDGKVHTCCIDYNSQMVIGDMKESSIEDVWFGEKRNTIFEMMSVNEFQNLKLCSTCNAPYTVKTKERNTDKTDIIQPSSQKP